MTGTSPTAGSPAGGWNRDAKLRCVVCEAWTGIGAQYRGCPACTGEAHAGPLEVVYMDSSGPASRAIPDVVDWLRRNRQVIGGEARVRLGRVVTPLIKLPRLGAGLLVKNETLNPTWGHKDRLHEVGVGVARLLGARGVVATSTGNHGAAAAAHAAAAGLPSVVFCHPRASTTAISMISAYGGLVAQLPAQETRVAIARLVDGGWFPATSMDPVITGRSNPYGAEGYKEIAYEIVTALGRIPVAVIVPTASGDTIYGVAKGFAEVSEFSGLPMPLIVAGQPAGADALARSFTAGVQVEVPEADSFALSVADPVSGRQALAALQRWNGAVIAVGDEDIKQAGVDAARGGLLLEPASALSLAVYRRLVAGGGVEDSDAVVALATSSGAKWPKELEELFHPRVIDAPAELADEIATRAAAEGTQDTQ